MKTEITLNLKASKAQALETELFMLKDHHFDAHPILDSKNPWFLDVYHENTNTQLELKGVAPYVILYFADDYSFAGATFNLKNHNSPFSVLTPYRKILLVKWPVNFDLGDVIGLKAGS